MTATRIAACSRHRPPERAGAATPYLLAPLAFLALVSLAGCPRDRTPMPKGPPPDYEAPRGYDAPDLDGPATASLPDPGDLPPPPPAPTTAAPSAAPPGSASAAPTAPTASAPAPTPSGTGPAASHAVPDPSAVPAPFGTPGRATPIGTAPVPAPAEPKKLP